MFADGVVGGIGPVEVVEVGLGIGKYVVGGEFLDAVVHAGLSIEGLRAARIADPGEFRAGDPYGLGEQGDFVGRDLDGLGSTFTRRKES